MEADEVRTVESAILNVEVLCLMAENRDATAMIARRRRRRHPKVS